MPNLGMKHITLISQNNRGLGSYWVRFYKPTKKGEKRELAHSKTFPLSRYSSIDSALRAAKRHRNKMIKERPELVNTQNGGTHLKNRYRKHHQKINKNNKYDLPVGIYYQTKLNPSSGTTYHIFSVSWMSTVDSKRVFNRKSFSFKPHVKGDDMRALKQAKAHRKRMEKEHYIGSIN